MMVPLSSGRKEGGGVGQAIKGVLFRIKSSRRSSSLQGRIWIGAGGREKFQEREIAGSGVGENLNL